MTETIPENQDLKRLRECVTTVHLLKQAKGFNLISDEDYKNFIDSFNDKTHTIINKLIDSIIGG